MRKVEKPWGHEEIWAETERYVGKIITILPKNRLSLQYHELKEETVYVLSGVLRVWTDDNDELYKDYNKGSVYHVSPRQVHRFGSAYGTTKILEVSTPELDDVIRIADDYKR